MLPSAHAYLSHTYIRCSLRVWRFSYLISLHYNHEREIERDIPKYTLLSKCTEFQDVAHHIMLRIILFQHLRYMSHTNAKYYILFRLIGGHLYYLSAFIARIEKKTSDLETTEIHTRLPLEVNPLPAGLGLLQNVRRLGTRWKQHLKPLGNSRNLVFYNTRSSYVNDSTRRGRTFPSGTLFRQLEVELMWPWVSFTRTCLDKPLARRILCVMEVYRYRYIYELLDLVFSP